MSQQQARPIDIPSTTARTVVFPLKTDYVIVYLNIFSFDFYSPDLTGDQVSTEEVNQFFSKLHSAFRKPFPADSKIRHWFLPGSLFLLFVAPLIVFWSLPEDFDMTFGKFFFIIWLESFVLFENWKKSKRCKQQPTDILFERGQDIADEHNEILRDRGLKWRLPAQFPHWIELTKDLKKQANEFQVETEEKVTFNLKRGRYSKDFYSPEMTDGRVSHEEMHEFISQINADLRRPSAGMNPGWFVFCLVFDAWILALINIDYDLSELLSSFKNFVIAVILLACSIYIVTWVASRDKRKFRAHFQGLISEFNETLRGRGLRWNLPTHFPGSIELCKDYSNQNSSNQEHDSLATSSEDDGEAGNQNENQRCRNNLSAPLLEDHD